MKINLMEERVGKNKVKKVPFLISIFILAAVCVFFIIIFSSKYNIKESASIGIIGGADGPTAIYIAEKQSWRNVLICSLIVVIFDLIIFTMIGIIGNKRQKSLLGLIVLVIVIFNLLIAILLFPSAAIILFSINIIIIIVFIIRKIWNKRKRDIN